MSTKEDRQRKVFPVSILLDFERELLLKHLEGYMLTKTEAAKLEKLVRRLKTQG